jgi:hypothetical protein
LYYDLGRRALRGEAAMKRTTKMQWVALACILVVLAGAAMTVVGLATSKSPGDGSNAGGPLVVVGLLVFVVGIVAGKMVTRQKK